MTSSSCPKKNDSNSERDMFARLLATGAVVNQPKPEALNAAGRLEGMGLIKVAHREYVECVNFQDRDVPRYNRDCCGKIYIDLRLDEGGDDYTCPDCDRVVYPIRNRKQRFKDFRSTVLPDGVLAHVLAELARLKAPVKELAKAVWRVDIGELGVTVCILDYCPEKFLTHDWARSQPTLYIGVNERWLRDRFLNEAWLVRVSLADMVAGKAGMEDLLNQAADSTRLATVPVYARGALPIINDTKPATISKRRFTVEVGAKEIRVDGVSVVSPQASSRYLLFRILWERFIKDLLEGRPPDEFRPASIETLSDEIQKRADGAVDDITSLRRNLNRFQDDIEKAVKVQIGNPINRNDIIQTCPKVDQGDRDFGYRLNPFTVLIRPLQSD